ncbi:hypothetical protein H671_8g19541 [Cricetulus griseus]|uniref:Uncharacterized protein n=1 Tax=Cricetulus griseus TaxID=10029 RepID=A0A061HZV7_CRIGR|nr:hypothetical protein H671_8g19541 [Cricetulus griseus]
MSLLGSSLFTSFSGSVDCRLHNLHILLYSTYILRLKKKGGHQSCLKPEEISIVGKTVSKSNLWKKGFIWLVHPNHCSSLSEFKQGQNLEAGTEAEIMDECPSLA